MNRGFARAGVLVGYAGTGCFLLSERSVDARRPGSALWWVPSVYDATVFQDEELARSAFARSGAGDVGMMRLVRTEDVEGSRKDAKTQSKAGQEVGCVAGPTSDFRLLTSGGAVVVREGRAA